MNKQLKEVLARLRRDSSRDPGVLDAIELLSESITRNFPGSARRIGTILTKHGSATQVFHDLAGLQFRMLKRSLDNQRKTVAVYHTHSFYRDHFGNLVKELRKRDLNVVILLDLIDGNYHQHGFDQDPCVLYAGHGLMKQFDFLDAIICMDLIVVGKRLPMSPFKIALSHGLHTAWSGKNIDLTRVVNDFGYLSYVFDCFALPFKIPGDHNIPRTLLKNLYPLDMVNHRGRRFRVMPAGYPKLDRLIDAVNKAQPDKVIVYATGHTDNKFSSIRGDGERIVRKILSGFKEYRLVFRPHPLTRDQRDVLELVRGFHSHPRFTFDTESSYLDTYSQAALMVTDESRTPVTFGLATSRPVVFFQRGADKISAYNPYRYPFAEIVTGLTRLIPAMRKALVESKQVTRQIISFRNRSLANIGHADSAIADFTVRLLNKRKTPGLLSLPLCRSTKPSNLNDYENSVKLLLKRYNPSYACEVADEGVRRFPENPTIHLLSATAWSAAGNTIQSAMHVLSALASPGIRSETRLLDDAVSRLHTFEPHVLAQAVSSSKFQQFSARAFLKDFVRQRLLFLVEKYGKIGLFPGGQHTRWITGVVRDAIPSERIIILDDSIPLSPSLNDYACVTAEQFQRHRLKRIVLSTDAPIPALRDRANELFGQKLVYLYTDVWNNRNLL